MVSVHVTYVSKKISKIRWRPVLESSLQHENASEFAAGSWNDEKNIVAVWKYQSPSEDVESENDSFSGSFSDPELLSKVSHKGDVMDLKFLAHDLLVSTSSNGSVSLYKYNNQSLQVSQCWTDVHTFPSKVAPCTAVDMKGEEICTVGEDGVVALLNVQRKQLLWKKVLDSTSLTGVCYVRQQEVVTSNIRGQLKVFDLRSKELKTNFLLSHGEEGGGIIFLGQHPSQAHLLVSGSEKGLLGLWDLRQERGPLASLSVHTGALTCAKFHPRNPELLFTCGLDGCLLQWDASKISLLNPAEALNPRTHRNASTGLSATLDSQKALFSSKSDSSNPWLNCETQKQHLEITSLVGPLTLPISSLDIEDEMLLCTADNETIFSVSGISAAST